MNKSGVRRIGTLGVGLGMSIAIFVLLAQNAFAYHLEGFTWANQPAPHNCCANLNVQFAGIHYSSDYTVWDNGMNAWTNSPAYIVYHVVSSSSITLYDESNSNVSWDGLTYENDFLGHFVNEQGYLNYYYVKNYSADEAQGVSNHELGHVAGLAHTNGCVIMTPDTSTRWDQCGIDTPQTDDDNGIDAMY